MTACCPFCGAPQGAGLLCAADTERLERDLAAVPDLILELECTLARQARVGGGGGGCLASEKNPMHPTAWITLGALANTLTTWARDLDAAWWPGIEIHPAAAAAGFLLLSINDIRRHPAAAELADEIGYAVAASRREVDRSAERQYLGKCLAVTADGRCAEELWARPYATVARCKTCEHEHDVAERRLWLLEQAADMLVSVREASRYIGRIGQIAVTEASIRSYLHRGRIAYRTGTTIRLGDLLQVLADESARQSA